MGARQNLELAWGYEGTWPSPIASEHEVEIVTRAVRRATSGKKAAKFGML
jgi:hypothetical protein